MRSMMRKSVVKGKIPVVCSLEQPIRQTFASSMKMERPQGTDAAGKLFVRTCGSQVLPVHDTDSAPC